jgi:hypothetical protein
MRWRRFIVDPDQLGENLVVVRDEDVVLLPQFLEDCGRQDGVMVDVFDRVIERSVILSISVLDV